MKVGQKYSHMSKPKEIIDVLHIREEVNLNERSSNCNNLENLIKLLYAKGILSDQDIYDNFIEKWTWEIVEDE